MRINKSPITKIVLFLLLFSWFTTQAQQYCFQSYSLKDGLPQSEVNSIVQTPYGTLWVGTNGRGIAEFDGNSFSSINIKNITQLKTILSLYKSKQNTIYISTPKKILSYNGIEIKKLNIDTIQLFVNNQFAELTETNELFYLRTKTNLSELYLIKTDSVILFNKKYPELENIKIEHIFSDTLSQKLYINSFGKNYVYHSEKLEKITFKYKNFKKIKAAYPFGRYGDTLLVAINNGTKYQIIKSSEGKTELFPNPKQLNIDFKRGINLDNDGNLWLQSPSGILKYKNNQLTEISKKNGLPVENCLSMIKDQYNNLWIGTAGAGLLKYCGDEIRSYTEKEGLHSNIVRCFYEETKDKLWIGTEGGGISLLEIKENKITTFLQNNLAANKVYSIAKFKNKILAATAAGIYAYNGTNFSSYNHILKIPPHTGIRYLTTDDDSLWIAMQNDGVACFYKGTLKKYTTADSLSSNYIRHIYIDKQKRIWISTLSGINYVKNGKVFTPQSNLSSLNMMSVTEDTKGRIWLASYSSGLFQYQEDSNKLVQVKIIGSNNENPLIYSVKFDSKNRLWLGGQTGIARFRLVGNQSITAERSWNINNKSLETNGNALYSRERYSMLYFCIIKRGLTI